MWSCTWSGEPLVRGRNGVVMAISAEGQGLWSIDLGQPTSEDSGSPLAPVMYGGARVGVDRW
jgi:hypothetical protein